MCLCGLQGELLPCCGGEIPRFWKFAGMQLPAGKGWLVEVVSMGLSERLWIRNSP